MSGFCVLTTHPVVLVATGVVCALGAIGPRENSAAEIVARAATFATRSRWTRVDIEQRGSHVAIGARGWRRAQLFEVRHRGRWDLSGEDRRFDAQFAGTLERVATNGGGAVSWHVHCARERTLSVLALPASVRAPRATQALGDPVRFSNGPWIYERWRYVRDATDVMALFSVVSARTAPHESLLRDLAPFASLRDVAVVVHVVSSSRANSVVGRHAHRWRANLALVALGGFRQRASMDAATVLLDERERDVAAGRALCEVQVFVIVRAKSRAGLDDEVRALRDDARRCGVELRRGDGRHAVWFCAQLPGALGTRSA